MNYSPIIKILTLQSSMKYMKLLIQAPTFKNNLINTKGLCFFFFLLCTAHKRNIEKNETAIDYNIISIC